MHGEHEQAKSEPKEQAASKDASSKGRRKQHLAILVGMLACAAIGAGAGTAAWLLGSSGSGDTGSYIIPQGEMSDEEARNMLDEMAQRSRISISVAPEMQLTESGDLRVNFIVAEPNNGFSERIEIEQNGRIVYRSGIVAPGHRVEWGDAESAVVGDAVATVYAVSNGADTGNPVSVEVKIAEADIRHTQEKPYET